MKKKLTSKERDNLGKVVRDFFPNYNPDDKVVRLEGGIVNSTYFVEVEKKPFIFQQINLIKSYLDAQNLTQDYQIIANKISDVSDINFGMMPLVKTKFDSDFTLCDEKFWRCFNYIDNDPLNNLNVSNINSLGEYLGELHLAFKNINYSPSFSIPNFHNTSKIVNKLKGLNKFAKKNDFLEQFNFICENVERHFLPKKLETQLLHGDPKIDNFLFKSDNPIAIIDFDTMFFGNPLLDLGDAMRSWCKVDNCFDLDLFESACEGYSHINPKYKSREVKNALGLITLELATRYFIDAKDQNYFLFNNDKFQSLNEQNLRSCDLMLEYYKTQQH